MGRSVVASYCISFTGPTEAFPEPASGWARPPEACGCVLGRSDSGGLTAKLRCLPSSRCRRPGCVQVRVCREAMALQTSALGDAAMRLSVYPRLSPGAGVSGVEQWKLGGGSGEVL